MEGRSTQLVPGERKLRGPKQELHQHASFNRDNCDKNIIKYFCIESNDSASQRNVV